MTAFTLIERFELGGFYELLRDGRSSIRPQELPRADYALFDAPAFQGAFVEQRAAGEASAHFYLQNMSCYACAWLCEEITRKLDPEARLAINLASGAAVLHFNPERHALSRFIEPIESLGFAVSPNRSYGVDKRSDIKRIGVSLFCLMNIMMLAFPEYLDVSSLELRFRELFRWISALLAAVSVFYCAWPLLRGSLVALRRRTLHLDIPLALALSSSYIYSLYNTWIGHSHVYFDTTSAVVSLLLIGRFAQGQVLARLQRENSRFLESEERFVRVVYLLREESKRLSEVESGEELRFLPGEVIPVAGELLDAQAEIDYGLLKGESRISAVRRGEPIEAGAVCGSQPISLRTTQPGSASELLRLGRIAAALHEQKGRFSMLSEQMAKGFVLLVLSAACLSFFFYLPQGSSIALTRFVTVLLVACPCIFAFGAPLVTARAFEQGLRRGLLFKSQRALEGLSRIEHFYFDKTGTLTDEEAHVKSALVYDETLAALGINRGRLLALLRNLPTLTQHHVGRALAQWAGSAGEQDSSKLELKAVREYFGQGISLVWNGLELRIGRFSFCFGEQNDNTRLEALRYSYVAANGLPLLQFELEESLRGEAQAVLKKLHDAKKELWILTGDHQGRAAAIAEALGIPKEQVLAQLTPEGKEQNIARSPRSAMVGNGINDALALSKVAIGVATANATATLKEEADLVLLRGGLSPLLDALLLSGAARAAMLRCFGFALFFNLIGLSLAVSGRVTPLIAAVLMPLSSLTIFAIAQGWRAPSME